GSRAALFFLIRRIASVRDTAEDFPSPLLRVLEYDLPDIAECDAAMLVADLVLSNERAVLAFVADANAQAKARHVFIELDVLSLAGLDFELGDSRLTELHGPSVLGRTWEYRNLLPKSSRVPLWSCMIEGLRRLARVLGRPVFPCPQYFAIKEIAGERN